jgi:hypothetical protein
MNVSQQIVASLVLVAELGVLAVFVGATRIVNVEESLTVVRTGPSNVAQIADPPEWGGLLATARTIESLWTTRWLILVPGVAFALTAIAVAAIGFAFARRYARRDVLQDLRWPRAGGLVAVVLGLVVISSLIPERYAAAREWASTARAELGPGSDTAAAFSHAGLRSLTATDYAVRRETTNVVRSGPVLARIGSVTVDEQSSRENNAPLNSRNVQAFISSSTGGGIVDAPLVYAARGISAADFPLPLSTTLYAGKLPELGTLVKDYPDDYAGIDVRGKVVLLVRFVGVATRPATSRTISNVQGPSVEDAVAAAIRRGAAAVLFIDPALRLYTDGTGEMYALNGVVGGPNPYLKAEQDSPPTRTSGVPVVVLSPKAASAMVAPLGVDLTAFNRLDTLYEYANTRSAARDLGVRAHLEVPLERRSAVATSYVGEVVGASPDAARVLVWAPRRGDTNPTIEVLTALARTLGARNVPFILVDFDPSLDPRGNTESVADLLKGRRIGLVLVLDRLDGKALRFTTPYGDLVPALDLYADKAAARHQVTRTTATMSQLSGIAPFIEIKTVVVNGDGGDGDVRPDAAAFVGYLAGRLAMGAEELPR